MKKMLSIITVLSLTLFFTITAQAKIGQNVIDNILLIATLDKNEEAIMMGTGFIISNEGHVLTNEHVIQGGEFFMFCSQKIKNSDFDCEKVGRLELLASDKDLDLALLKLPEGLKSTGTQSYLVLADSGLTEIGDELSIIGYPGTGSSTLNLSRGVVSGFAGDYIKTDTRLFPGNSGGPALNENNEVIGIATALTSDDYKNLGLLIPSNMVREWLKSVGFTSQMTQKFRVKTSLTAEDCSQKATFAKNSKICRYILHQGTR